MTQHFHHAGGPTAPVFQEWRATWEANLNISVQLHDVKRVVGITHRDCGTVEPVA